jgi:hypothetical protein
LTVVRSIQASNMSSELLSNSIPFILIAATLLGLATIIIKLIRTKIRTDDPVVQNAFDDVKNTFIGSVCICIFLGSWLYNENIKESKENDKQKRQNSFLSNQLIGLRKDLADRKNELDNYKSLIQEAQISLEYTADSRRRTSSEIQKRVLNCISLTSRLLSLNKSSREGILTARNNLNAQKENLDLSDELFEYQKITLDMLDQNLDQSDFDLKSMARHLYVIEKKIKDANANEPDDLLNAMRSLRLDEYIPLTQ